MKSIDTEYKGYLFRSRLEARWAIFFDEMGIKWQYEPAGYETEGWEGKWKGKKVKYLPDFFLPELKLHVEVKGSVEQLKKDSERLEQILDFGSPLPDFDDSLDCTTGRGLLILGEIPVVNTSLGYAEIVFHPVIRHHKGLHIQYLAFFPGGVYLPTDSNLFLMGTGVNLTETWDSSQDINHLNGVKYIARLQFKQVPDAYKIAKQARFEHGAKYARA